MSTEEKLKVALYAMEIMHNTTTDECVREYCAKLLGELEAARIIGWSNALKDDANKVNLA